MRARKAREAAGLDAKTAAKRARVTPAYLLQCERTNKFSYALAMRLYKIYNCRLEVFVCAVR